MQLPREHYKQLGKALKSFSSDELIPFVRLELGWYADEIYSPQVNKGDAIYELIGWAERRDLVGELIAAGLRQRPRDTDFQELAVLYPSQPRPEEGRPTSAAPPAGTVVIVNVEHATAGATVIGYVDQRRPASD